MKWPESQFSHMQNGDRNAYLTLFDKCDTGIWLGLVKVGFHITKGEVTRQFWEGREQQGKSLGTFILGIFKFYS